MTKDEMRNKAFEAYMKSNGDNPSLKMMAAVDQAFILGLMYAQDIARERDAYEVEFTLEKMIAEKNKELEKDLVL